MKGRAFRIGALIGGGLSLLAALGMDALSGDIPGRSWPEAVAHDLTALTGTEISPSGFLAYSLALLAVAVMVAIGALMGGACGSLLERFFGLFHEDES